MQPRTDKVGKFLFCSYSFRCFYQPYHGFSNHLLGQCARDPGPYLVKIELVACLCSQMVDKQLLLPQGALRKTSLMCTQASWLHLQQLAGLLRAGKHHGGRAAAEQNLRAWGGAIQAASLPDLQLGSLLWLHQIETVLRDLLYLAVHHQKRWAL